MPAAERGESIEAESGHAFQRRGVTNVDGKETFAAVRLANDVDLKNDREIEGALIT